MNSILPDFLGSFFEKALLPGCPEGRPFENEPTLEIVWNQYSHSPKGLRLFDDFDVDVFQALHYE